MKTLRSSAKANYVAAFILGALIALMLSRPARSAEPFRLDRIGIVQISSTDDGQLQLRNGILSLDKSIAWRGSQTIPRPANVPAGALNRPLVRVDAWRAYYGLGFGAVSAFEILDGAVVFVVGDTGYFAVAPSEDVLLANGLVVNLSTRAQIQPGNGSVIAGFVIGERARTVLIRAVGPTLQKFGIGAPVANPSLTLRRNGQIIAQNDGWSADPAAVDLRRAAAHVGAFALDEGSRDAASLVILGPGSYTVQVTSGDSAPSARDVLVEIYTVPEDFFPTTDTND